MYINIKDDPTLIDFLEARDIKEYTKETCIKRLKQYCKLTGKTPSELIEEAEDEERIRMRNRKIKRYFMIIKNT